jgi:hypothetical protein
MCALARVDQVAIVMWLQLKQLRRLGRMVAIASLLATVFVWSAMYRFFTEKRGSDENEP